MSACSFLGRWRGRPGSPLSAGMASMHGSNSIESCRLAPLTNTTNGMPRASTTICRLEPSLPLSVGLGPVCWPPGGLGLSSRQCWLVPNRSGHAHAGESTSRGATTPTLRRPANHAIDASKSCHYRSPWIELVLPRDVCLKHKQDSIEGCLIADSALARASLVGWNKGGDQGL